ncbi:MAG: glycoside hydrolase family 2 TIM barrel-domain containing protein [Breznakibacter sp.]
MKCIALALLLALPCISLGQTRNRQTINEHWKFCKEDVKNAFEAGFDDASWETVYLPHSWNIGDIEDEAYGWYRGTGWYRKSLRIGSIPKDRRTFLWFDAANQVCEVFVNGKPAGEKHAGGYTPFSFDVTELLVPDTINQIAVKLDNSHHPDVAPLSADFVFYGGIYRDVYLIEANATHFDLQNQGTGVFIQTPEVSEQSGTVIVRADIVNKNKKGTFTISHTILDAKRNAVAAVSQNVMLNHLEQKSFISKEIKISTPHLWSPDSPYLYTVVSEIRDRSGKIADRVENPLGFRWFRFDPQEGFFLNGKHLKLMGTNRHQDYIGYGNALTDDMHRHDLKLMKDLGINCFRISHYPHDPSVLEMADRYGFICFEEIPVINYITRTDTYLESTKRQISEMIRRDFNHPCIVAWNQSNESALSRPPYLKDEDYETYSIDLAGFYKKLNEHIKGEDPTRYSMIVHNSGVADHYKRNYHQAGVIGYNLYLGWYESEINDIFAYLESMPEINPAASWFISEFGAGADARIRSFDPLPWDHSIEYQLKFNKVYQKAIARYPFIAGGTAWNFNDFYSEGRREVQPHINNKGLVTLNRQKKDSYYFFQAAWSKYAVANIGSKLWENRTGIESSGNSGICFQPVEVYANTGEAELFLNNQSLGKKKISDFVASWDVPFVNGENLLELRAEKGAQQITDFHKVHFKLIPRDLKSDNLPFDEIAVNVGSNCYFIDDKQNNYLWMPDKPYEKGSYGYTGGKRYVRDEKRGILGAVDNIWGTLNEPVYQTQLINPSYQFDVPKGAYEVTLLFADLDNSSVESIFDVQINGNKVWKNLNLRKEYGRYTAVSRRFEITVNDEKGIEIMFPAQQGQAVLNGIVVRKLM